MLTATAALGQRVRAVGTVTAQYELPDGTVLDTYFDEYRIAADPVLLAEVGAAMAPLVPSDVDVLAGLELGGVPFALALSAATGVPAVLVRKKRKSYGTRRQVEGCALDGARVALVDDVARSGGQLTSAAQAISAIGGRTIAALVVLARTGSARRVLAAEGIALHSLLTDGDPRTKAPATDEEGA